MINKEEKKSYKHSISGYDLNSSAFLAAFLSRSCLIIYLFALKLLALLLAKLKRHLFFRQFLINIYPPQRPNSIAHYGNDVNICAHPF